MTTIAPKKNSVLIKSEKDGIKKTVIINNEGNYLIQKTNIATKEVLAFAILSSDVFEIQEVIEFFTKY